MMPVTSLIDGIASLLHPKQYRAQKLVLNQLRAQKDQILHGHLLKDILPVWPTAFNVVGIISNQLTPAHRDVGGSHAALDILMPAGPHSNGRMTLPGLGMALEYHPGTLVGMSGRVVRHAATVTGDRACIAFYCRENILKALNVEVWDWVNVSEYI